MDNNKVPLKVTVQFRDMWGGHGVQMKHVVSTVLTEKSYVSRPEHLG